MFPGRITPMSDSLYVRASDGIRFTSAKSRNVLVIVARSFLGVSGRKEALPECFNEVFDTHVVGPVPHPILTSAHSIPR